MSSDPKVFTPYSTIVDLNPDDDLELWVPEDDRDRMVAYSRYEEIYWNHQEAFSLVQRGDEDDQTIYIPNAMTIVDTTAHFYMKGLSLTSTDAATQAALKKFMDREMFISEFHVSKHSGVTRGDHILHLTADPSKPQGTRLSVNSIDPAIYFPETDPDDMDRLLAVNLAEFEQDETDPSKSWMKVLRYQYVNEGGRRRVQVSEAKFEVKDWWKGRNKAKKLEQLVEPRLLPERITTIPVYHFKNKQWQGWPFGSSELKGYETILQAIHQGATDEQMALSLEGLGVYATSSGPPKDSEGKDTNWVIAPGYVMELDNPTATFRRVEGINSVKPFQEHFEFLVNSMYEASATFRSGSIDATIAESGIALAIRFLPTAAKLEQRDTAGVGKLQQFFFDWKAWHFVYEDVALAGEVDVELGDKLPIDKQDMLNTLNNMVDRKTIPKKFYREQVATLFGLVLPPDIDQMLEDEAQAAFEEAQKRAELTLRTNDEESDDNSRNGSHRNESGGTEATSGARPKRSGRARAGA